MNIANEAARKVSMMNALMNASHQELSDKCETMKKALEKEK